MSLNLLISILGSPAFIISICALILSLLSFLYTYVKDREQNRRWDSVNLARIVIRDLQFTSWRNVQRKDILNIDWGYNDPLGFVTSDGSGNLNTDILQIPIQVVAVHSQEGMLEGINAITVSELKQSLTITRRNPADYSVEKLLRIIYAIENVGSTRASAVLLSVKIHEANLKFPAITKGVSQPLEPGEKSWSLTNFRIPLDEALPKELYLSIAVQFTDIHDHTHEQNFRYVFDKSVATFRRT